MASKEMFESTGWGATTGNKWFSSALPGMYLGAVGAYDWSGTIVKYDSSNDVTPDIPDYDQVRAVLPSRTKISYLGYAVTSGIYNGGDNEFVAIGAPRNQLLGAVVVYQPQANNANFTNSHTIYPKANVSKQLGSYFGGVLLSVDVNGDRMDDLLVGAPLFIGSNYDDGRVFVYVTSGRNNPSRWASDAYTPTVLSGGAADQGGRFGTAMSSAGDLNDDGFKDVIIGAPYLDNNQGAVYVFHGTSNGIDPKYKQVIRASSLPNTNLQYFGLSLEGGHDLDGNDYPDIAVGAPKSDAVIIFRSRPVAKIQAEFEFSSPRIPVFECFSKADGNCVQLKVCLRIFGTNIEPSISMNFTIKLDKGLETNRVEFRENGTTAKSELKETVTIAKETRTCYNYKVYVKRPISDYSRPITATLQYDLTTAHTSKSLSSVRDPTTSNMKTATTSFHRTCAQDCNYDLSMKASIVLPQATIDINGQRKDLTDEGKQLVISKQTESSPIIVKANLSNAFEFAFDVRVSISFNRLLSWKRVFNVQSSNKNSTSPCVRGNNIITRSSPTSTYSSTILSYQYNSTLGNIMPAGGWCYFEFNLTSSELNRDGNVGELNVTLKAYTQNTGNETDRNPNQNDAEILRPIRYRADISVLATRGEILVPFNFTNTNDTTPFVLDIGQNTSSVEVKYQISGRGHSTVPQSRFDFTFPYTLPENDIYHLLYLYKYSCDVPNSGVGCVCDTTLVNPYKLRETYTSNTTGLPTANLISNPEPINESIAYDCSDPNNLPLGVCRTFSCRITNLNPGGTVQVSVKLRLWSHSLHLVHNSTLVSLFSGFQYTTADSKYLINDQNKKATTFNSTATTLARLFTPPVPITDADNLWIYIVAAIGGLLLLIIIIIVLWKTGFFKSKYAEKKEKEKLTWTQANTSE